MTGRGFRAKSGEASRKDDMTRLAAILLIFCTAAAQAAPGADAPQRQEKISHYVSQRAAQAFLREGPTFQHKVLWVFKHKGYPFGVIAQYDTWRRVVTADGTVGWMAAAMLAEQRTVLVTGKGQVKIMAGAYGGKVVGLANPGATANLVSCEPQVCRIKGEGIDGWITRVRIWGVAQGEIIH
jgi:SH3-like domain-containing protein